MRQVILWTALAAVRLTACGAGFFGGHSGRTVDFGAESPRAAGKASVDGETLTIGYDFTRGGRTVAVGFDLREKPTVESVALDMNYGVDVRLAVRLTDSGGQVFRRVFGILGSEWEHASLNLSDEGWTFCGGAQDGVFRQPAVRVEFVAESAFFESAGMAGDLQVRNVALSAKPVASDLGAFPPPLRNVSFEAAMRLASNAYARLDVLVPQLESKGVGAKSRATMCVLEKFFGWVALDLQHGLTKRALDESREMAAIGGRAVGRAEDILAGWTLDFPVPRYQASKIEISHAQAIADRKWPDGHVDRGPVFFNGFGHFGLARDDLARFPELGCDLLQFEICPSWVMPTETQVARWVPEDAVRTLDRAASNGVAVALLLSPHGWPKWTYEKWPYLRECGCYGGFCPYDSNVRSVIERYFKLIIPRIRGNKGLHSVCLTNEPWTGNFDKCPRLRARWVAWLREKYGTLKNLKARLGLDLKDFGDAKVPPVTTDGKPAPVLAEFIRFNRACLAEWHRWMADVVHGMAPELPVHSKIQVCPIQWQSHVFYSVDPVQFGGFCQYNGNDALDFFMPKDRWAHNWWGMEIGYDLQRSAADVPVLNTENHLHPDRSHGTYMPGAHTYAALWQNALHGQNGSALWCWGRAYDDGKSDFNGLVLNRPECLEAYAHCALDLSRLADRLAPLQNMPPSVLVLYSTEYVLHGGQHALGAAYRAANFIGQPLGVVSEEMVADFGTGTLKRPFDSAKVILLPDVKGVALPKAVRAGLARFKSAGGRVLPVGTKGEAEQHRLLAENAARWGLPGYPVARDPGTGLPPFGVETRGVTRDGVSLVSLCNHTSRPIRVKLAKRGVDLITGGNTAAELTLRPLVPRLIEYGCRTGGCKRPADHVDPFVGTAGTGHTTPAACVPFGLVQAGPDTGNSDWHHCSGYVYGDRRIHGFSQTHLNGTGCMDLGDLLLLPSAGDPDWSKGLAYDKSSEYAEPGRYAVRVGEVDVEIAAAAHSVIYRFDYASSKAKRLLVDCQWGMVENGRLQRHVREAQVALDGKTGVSGALRVCQWVDRRYGFVVEFGRPCKSCTELPRENGEKAPRYVFDFDLKDGESLLVKVGLSAGTGTEDACSLAGRARRNLEAEMPGWSIEGVKDEARRKWNEVLGRAVVEGTEDMKKNWYTSLYHLCVQPNDIADVGEKPFYSTFSCWDTFRAAGPLYTVLYPGKAAEFVDSMLAQGRRSGWLPVWTLWGKDNQCMIGTHSIPMIVDAFLKGIWPQSDDSAIEQCYAQIKETLTGKHPGRIKEDWESYDKYGYYPFDVIKGESVSRTMECAYDDWCAAVMAEKLGHEEDAAFFFRRSASWKNVFDPSLGMARGRDSKGNWRTPYDSFSLGHGAGSANDFTEGNAFQYTWHVMQDVPGLVAAMGGREKFVKNLDSLFEAPSRTEGMGEVLDVTGLLGQYVHGNEPSHHVIYFYPQVGHPEKAAARIREVFDRFYLPKPDGLCGNDDCGQMSAWYLFSAMGFYPFNPCGGEYVIGAPQVPHVMLKLANGKTFTMIAKNLSERNRYVKSVLLNGNPVSNWMICHESIANGGELQFEMCDRP